MASRAYTYLLLVALCSLLVASCSAADGKGRKLLQGDTPDDVAMSPGDTPDDVAVSPGDTPDDVDVAQSNPGQGNAGLVKGKYKAAPKGSKKVPDEYIVTLVEGADLDAVSDELTIRKGGVKKSQWRIESFHGFGAKVPPGRADEILAAWEEDPRVASIDDNRILNINPTQTNAVWGLDRVDQARLPLSTTYSYTSLGSGVVAYVIDTGVYHLHTDFGGRAEAGYDAITQTPGQVDNNGHGTHVAGTIGGSKYGVAKGVTIVPVKVCGADGSCSGSAILHALSWAVTTNRPTANRKKVINMSLGGGLWSALDSAVANATNAGVSVVVAAGNSNVDACGTSPARAASAITVGATTSTDARASFSNYGSCLDLFAPGNGILSTWIGSTSATRSISGTSMASPHAAGMVARLLSQNVCQSSVSNNAYITCVRDTLVNAATVNVVSAAGTGSPNRLLFRSSTQ